MLMVMLLPLMLSAAASEQEASPITVTLSSRGGGGGYASFENSLHPGNRIGYRFHEHTPLAYGEIPGTPADAGLDPDATNQLEQSFCMRPGVVTHAITLGNADWAPQRWTFYLAPAADGVELLWVVDTQDVGLSRYYSVQQCFRMGGVTNEEWRRKIAETPAFSEYDLWNAGNKASLTYVPQKGAWTSLPAEGDTVGARTPLGLAMDNARTSGSLDSMPKVGPYEARMLDPIDIGLITRTDAARTWLCGLYWQGTTHVSDHHPADCLHAIVNIGNIPAHSKRAIRGKIYWFQGSFEDLLSHWKRDFPQGDIPGN